MSQLSNPEVKAILRRDLYAFHVKALKTTMPGVEFLPNWHILAMCAFIEEMISGDVRRGIINIQPRMGKSLLCSVSLPMYLMMRNPATQVMCVSYSDPLAQQFHLLCRILSKQKWYRNLNAGLALKATGDSSMLKETNTTMQTTAQGHRLARSFGGSITGMGADWIVMDDANDMSQIKSEAHRQTINDTFDQTISTRLNNKEGRILLITQRGHVDDLTGHLIEKGGFKQLSIEAEATQDTNYELGKGLIYTRKKGALIDPRRFGIEQIAEWKNNLGSAGYQAQYQQNPQPPDGNLFKREWVQNVDKVPEFQYVVITGDIATSLGRGDYTAFLVWGYADGIWYLIAAHRDQLDQPGVLRFYAKLDQKYEPDLTVIERNGLGEGVIQHLRELGYKHVDGTTVTGNKVERAESVTPLLESKQVVFLKSMPLYDQFMSELLTFPSSKYDDMVDAFVLALSRRHEILRVAKIHRRPKRQHLPDHNRATHELSITTLGSGLHVRDNFYERTGCNVFF